MKKKWILGLTLAAIAVTLLCVWPRYTLVALVGMIAGWVGHYFYAKRSA